VQQKWTPYLMMLTLYNSISGLNEFVDEATYRLNGKVELSGQRNVSLSTMQASGDLPMPAPLGAGRLVWRQAQPALLNNVNPPDVTRSA